MPALSRADNSILGRWWWTVDRWTLGCVGALIGTGYILVLAASPAVAERIHVPRELFIFKQVVFLAVAGGLVVGVSLLSPRGVRRVALLGLAVALVMTALTLVIGVNIKGAQRWIALPGMAIQPSEFLKPCFAVVTAWLLDLGHRNRRIPGTTIVLVLYALILLMLKSQPDIGMIVVITAVLFAQLFVDGLNLGLAGFGLLAMAGGGIGAYLTFPHVQSRVQRFLHLKAAGNYQVDRSLEAFANGGLFGRGPGEGHIKDVLPDAHADFVFAVAGEEFGLIVCLVIVALFATVVLRGLARARDERDRYVLLAITGLATSFGLQAFVNMASTLHLIPAKGMTLPFISYGGSSAVSVGIEIGMLLALTRRRFGSEAT